MRLAAPWGLATLGLLVPLVIWYLLRARRPRRIVASTMVWQQVPRAMTAATPWQRFRPDLTFWLCALAIAAGALALARPYAIVPATLGDHTIIVVDVSGSMNAAEAGVSRLAMARQAVDDLTAGLAAGQQVSIIAAGPRAQVLVAGATTTDAITTALGRLPIQHGPADLADAFTLAGALQRANQVTVTHLVTDSEVPAGATGVMTDVAVTPIGTVRGNLAVQRLQIVPQGSGNSEVFVALRSWSQDPIQARLSVTINGDEVMGEALTFEPRGSIDRILALSGAPGDVVSASITPTDDTVDALAMDDTAWGLLRSPGEVAVTVATPGNLFLTAALEAVEGVTITQVAAVPESMAGIDLLVVDRVAAPATPVTPTLLIAPSRWPDGIAAAAAVELPTITFQSDHEIARAVDLSATAVATATPLRSSELAPVAGGPAGTMVGAGRLGGVGVVALGFALTDTNLPLTAAWPTMVANTVGWLAGAPASVAATAGGTVEVPIPTGYDSVRVSPPDSGAITVQAASPTLVVDRVGMWRLALGTPSADAVEAGLDPDTVDLAPALVVNPPTTEGDLAQGPPEATVIVDANDDADAELTDGRQPLATWILPVVLALLLAEWLRTTLPARRAGRTTAGNDGPAASGAAVSAAQDGVTS